MGYYVNIVSSTVSIPEENLEEAYKRMCALNFKEDIKRGGRWPKECEGQPQPNPDSWFAWMPWNYHETMSTAKEILEALGFECEMGVNLYIVAYNDKCGNEDIFLAEIADLMEGEMIWRGEEGETWKSVYTLGKPPKEYTGETIWREADTNIVSVWKEN